MSVRRWFIPDKCDFCHRKPTAFIIENGWITRRRWMCEVHVEMRARGLTIDNISRIKGD